VEADTARPVDGTGPEAREPRQTAYRNRFAAVYLGLAVVAGGAIGAFVVLLARPDAPAPEQWSSWAPSGSTDARVRQIADQVSARYKLPSGSQLAVATVEAPPRVTVNADQPDLPVKRIVIRPDTSRGRQEASDVRVFDASQTVVYKLCGLSQDCSISEGTASSDRHTLLRREALELALYTFRYVDDASHVVVFLPPPPVTNMTQERQPQTSVFLARGDVRAQLRRPLAFTLSTEAPSVGEISVQEYPRIAELTNDRTYTFEYSYQPADNSVLAVLSPT
jgi:hypothetical protein